MQFAYPYLLTLVPIYWLIRWYQYSGVSTDGDVIPYPSVDLLSSIPRSLKQQLRTPILGILEFSFIAALSIAAARPFSETVLPAEQEARNVMLTIDLSRSMETEDFGSALNASSRIDGVKKVVAEFIRERHHDRLGLVVFGNKAFVQAPLTLDQELVAQIVEQLSAGIAGDGTAIGDGLALSIKRLKEISSNTRAIILLTDGANNAGQFQPLKAAELAREEGIKVHTIGIGSTRQSRRLISNGIFTQTVIQKGEFDEATLKQIAELTGGVYFNAENMHQLREVYTQIEKLEETASDSPEQSHVEEHFAPFAFAALLCYLLLVILSRSVFLRLP